METVTSVSSELVLVLEIETRIAVEPDAFEVALIIRFGLTPGIPAIE